MGDEVEKISVSNEMLLRYAELSPNEIAAKTGFTPLEAARRLYELLDSRDYLTDRREERLLIIRMQTVAREAEDRMRDASDENFAAIANVVYRGLNSVGARFDARRKLTEVDINEITAAHARTFGRAFDAALEHIIEGLKQAHPDLDPYEIGRLQREGMQVAKGIVDEKVN
jgi:hypothetical protein